MAELSHHPHRCPGAKSVLQTGNTDPLEYQSGGLRQRGRIEKIRWPLREFRSIRPEQEGSGKHVEGCSF